MKRSVWIVEYWDEATKRWYPRWYPSGECHKTKSEAVYAFRRIDDPQIGYRITRYDAVEREK